MRRILTAAAVLALAMTSQAAGLRTPFGEVIVRNVKIGQTYSLYKLVNLPLRVINTGSDEVDLRVESIGIKPDELKAGYAAAAPEWIKVERSSFTLGPNREAVTDLLISLPNDPALLGRRFEADIWSHTINSGALQVGLRSRLLLHVDSTPPSDEDLKKKFVDETLANLDFTVMPINAQLSDIPAGREIDLRKERKISIKLINPNDRALNFRVRSIPSWESMIRPPEGYEDAPDPKWLRAEKEVMAVEGNSIADTSLRLDIPDEARYRGRNFFFIVSFELLEQKIPTRVFYRLMVSTTPDAKK